MSILFCIYIYTHRVAIYTELHHSFRHFPTNYIGLCLITRLDLVTGLGKCPSIVGSLPHSFFSGYISLSFLVIPPFFPQFSPFNYHLSPGWWFQTFLICHNIWDVILLIDFHIGWSTSQSLLFFLIGWSTNTLCAVASCRRQTCMFRRSRFCWTPTSGSTAWKAQRT